MELFYTPAENIDLAAESLLIEGDEFHHLVRVLRKKTGDRILVTDGAGLRCEVRLAAAGKKSVEGEILLHERVDRPKTGVTVALSLLKAPQRFDFFLEKATELGVSSIIPMITARTISQPSKEKTEGKLNRWKSIVLSAARQSKRYYLPGIIEPVPFSRVIGLQGYDLRLIPYEGSAEAYDVSCSGKKTLFLIGGEGGFTAGEVDEAKGAGFREISLGRSILRAETAGIFAVAMVRTELLIADSRDCF